MYQKNMDAVTQAEATAARLRAKDGRARGSGGGFAETGYGSTAGFPEPRYRGRLKSFDPTKGFGFIECPELRQQFGRSDVFLNQAVEGGIVVGSTVSFVVELSKDGKPQARRAVLEEADSALMPTRARKPPSG